MSEFTIQELQNISGLRLTIHNVEEELKLFTRLAVQLACDDVEFSLIFNMHNKTLCAKNKSRYRVRTLAEEFPFASILPYSSNHNSCRQEFAIGMDETRALQIVNVILQQKKKQLEDLTRELEALLKINLTPIQYLHQ